MLLIISIMATEKIGKECIISTLREGNMCKAGKKKTQENGTNKKHIIRRLKPKDISNYKMW